MCDVGGYHEIKSQIQAPIPRESPKPKTPSVDREEWILLYGVASTMVEVRLFGVLAADAIGAGTAGTDIATRRLRVPTVSVFLPLE